MHKSHTNLLIWLWAIFLVAHDKRGISATYIARELELTYPTAWLLLQRGRGTEQTPVLVGVSLDKLGLPLYVKMQVIPDVKGKTLLDFAESYIQPGSTISSDAYRSYKALAEGYDHIPIVFNPKENPDHLKWIHTMISNAKAFIGGTFHGLAPKHLQAYLDEFCFRTNRRKFKGQLFNRLLTACVSTDTITYHQITA